MPIYTRCIKPQSIDPKLFTDREDEYHHLKAILKSIILAKDCLLYTSDAADE